MVCSKCESPMLVIDSRENEGQSRRRRYKCPFCDERITMYEVTKEEYEGIRNMKVLELVSHNADWTDETKLHLIVGNSILMQKKVKEIVEKYGTKNVKCFSSHMLIIE